MTPTIMKTRSAAVGRCLCEHEPVDVAAWRLCWLLDAGFDATTAHRLARTASVDLHALLELVDRGCPPGLAARILAPLDLLGEAR